jgi:hypothetical protein
MTERIPDFDDLVGGDDLDRSERERLLRVHDLLVAAGPPAELPERLRTVTPPRATIIPFPRKYRFTAAAAAALVGVALFGAGYGVGQIGGDAEAFTVPMAGPRGATAELVVFRRDEAGNWPMRLKVTGLEPLAGGEVYELWLTRDGKAVAQCGSFAADPGRTEVPLNAPYPLGEGKFTGWIVVRSGSPEHTLLQTREV